MRNHVLISIEKILPAFLLGRCGGVVECGEIVGVLHVAWWCMQSIKY